MEGEGNWLTRKQDVIESQISQDLGGRVDTC
jgi:hypothetical protein